MSKKYKELAPTISALITKNEIKVKKDKISNEQSFVFNFVEPVLSKEAVEIALEYIRWMGASSIPWEYKEYYNNGPQDIAIKVCKKLGDRAITDEQVRVLYNEWKMIEGSDLEDPIEEAVAPVEEVVIDEPVTDIFEEPAKQVIETAKVTVNKKKSKKTLN